MPFEDFSRKIVQVKVVEWTILFNMQYGYAESFVHSAVQFFTVIRLIELRLWQDPVSVVPVLVDY